MLYRTLYYISVAAILLFCTSAGVLFYARQQPWVDFSVLEHYNPGKPSVLLDDEGKVWARFELDKRAIVPLSKIPPIVVNAFVAAEDWKFFSHSGLSYKGIIRSLVVNLMTLRRAQGASTITQQLVRLLFFEPRKSFIRKIKEQILALTVEQQFTKDQILETYLNHIYLGAGMYGVEAASQRFWGISVTDCSVDQAAVLAAIVRYPRRYCPLYNKKAAESRRNLILKNMYSLGFITYEQYQKSRIEPITINEHGKQECGAHLKETLRVFLEETYGKKRLYTGGLVIQTTLNSKMQKAAEKVFKECLARLRNQIAQDLEGALVSIDGSTGGIKALIGGSDFSASQFNRALQAKRQLGSAFKPLVYAQALLNGKTFVDTDVDEPLNMQVGDTVWNPVNASRTFKGTMTLAHALSHSNNCITIKTFMNTGPEKIAQCARTCGLELSHAYPSLALGCVEVTPLQATGMMNIFAHQGQFVQPHSLVWVKDEWGTKLYKTTREKKDILPCSIASQVAQVLTIRVEQARARNPKIWCNCDALGKSGTTNDSRTCWFVGATPQYTTAVYVGFDDNRALGRWIFGSRTAFPLWRAFNKAIEQPTKHFSYDPMLRSTTINSITGDPCSKESKNAITILVPQSN